MKRIYTYLKKFKWFFIVSILAMLMGIGLDMLIPQILKILIDDVIIAGQLHLLNIALLSIGLITISRCVLGYTKEYLCDYGSQKVIEDLRHDLFNHLQKLSFSFYDGVNTGELMSRMREDVDNIWQAISYGIRLFVEECLYFLVAAIILFLINWKLALLAMSIMPLIAFIAIRLEKEIGAVFGKISDEAARINTTAQENLVGARLVKAFGREKHEIKKFLDRNEKSYRLKLQQAGVWRKYFPTVELLTNVVIVMTTTAGGYLVIREELSIGNLVAFANYVMMLIWPMRMLGWLTNILAECRASVKKVERLFKVEPTIKDPENPVTPSKISGRVVFANVSFVCNGVTILDSINLEASPGNTIAIMGMTGSGKSSIINLMGRYYDCTGGNIYIDGVDVKDWSLNELRRHISVVMQETFLFSDTIEANVLFGSRKGSRKDIEIALKDAAIDEFIAELPVGLTTEIGERGIGLSGGQKQRLAIARALLRECKILILDDATSNLDMETEYEIQRALKRKKGITKFIIAHRISAVKDADEVLIIEEGRIVERGTHQQLMNRGGRYYDIYQEQFQELIS